MVFGKKGKDAADAGEAPPPAAPAPGPTGAQGASGESAGKGGSLAAKFGGLGTMAEFKVPDVPGLPKTLGQTKSIFTGKQSGTYSVNVASNPHWNDVLSYSADGSLVHFNGMDYINDETVTYSKRTRRGEMKYNIICWKNCCIRTETELRKSSHITFNSTDGAHRIRLEHVSGEAFFGEPRGPCADCFNCTPLCCSTIICKPCCRQGQLDWEKLKPETFEVFYDNEVVASISIQPGLKKGTQNTKKSPEISRATTVKDKGGKELFFMNEVYLPETVSPTYKCCACDCPVFENCKICCAPCCMPFCGGIRCPKPTCNCGPCTSCCQTGCDLTCACCNCIIGCVPCVMCCTNCALGCQACLGCIDKCLNRCKQPCCKFGIKEEVFYAEGATRYSLPFSDKHKAHRMIYPLSTREGVNNEAEAPKTWGYAAFTYMEDPTQSHRASLAVDPAKYKSGTAPIELLGALPLLIDLARGSVGGARTEWTFESRVYMNFFDPPEMVNFWPAAEVLQTVVAAHTLPDVVNPTHGDVAPKQQCMVADGIDDETAKLLGKPTAAE
mmetsp:Transcript_79050/g.164189  ORF Transcript_79050/g.164189 Transcript_79050/m.164189 type:complete len:554 (-) Transcript_79050:167-1828(-)